MFRVVRRFAVAFLCVLAAPAFAQTAEPAAPAQAPDSDASAGSAPAISIELNKLEPAQNACRGYFVVDNRSPKPLKELQIDVFLFDKQDVVLRRVALTFPNVRTNRMKVVLFDLADIACDDIGRLLVNDVLACTDAEGAAIEGCADMVGVTTRTEAKFAY